MMTATFAGAVIVSPFIVIVQLLPGWIALFAIFVGGAFIAARVRNFAVRALLVGLTGAFAWVLVVGVWPIGGMSVHAILKDIDAIRGPALLYGTFATLLAVIAEALGWAGRRLLR